MAVRERPIIFTPENAQKVFEGTKTQTRRILKPQPAGNGDYWDLYNKGPEWAFWLNDNRMSEPRTWPCPYGQPGDRLWIREHIWVPPHISYRMWRDGADTWPKAMYRAEMDSNDVEFGKEHKWKSKPSIHMPRWACRTVVELTEVRVERVQEITEEDAKAEGCEPHAPSGFDGRVYRRPFECLWESINGKGSWALNPFVWVLSFRRLNNGAR